MVGTTAPVVIPVTGPPGAGKSTALIRLCRCTPQLARFGVRDYGLRLAEQGDPLGLAMRATLQRQELLPDELVRQEFQHFLDNVPGTTRVVAVEGYPRDVRQCDDLLDVVRSRGTRVAAFVLVDVPDEVARARTANRRLCLRCGVPTDAPDAIACAYCGGPIARRRDDEAMRLEQRLSDYREVSRGPRAYFAERGLLRVVDGLMPPEQVHAALASLLGVDADPMPSAPSCPEGNGYAGMPVSVVDVMAARASALDHLADAPPVTAPLVGIRVGLADHLEPGAPLDTALDSVADAVTDRLVRAGDHPGPGAALVTGLPDGLDQARAFHERLFGRVWTAFRERAGLPGAGTAFQVKTGTISDGAIPLERYGSRWSFKDLHIDREVLLFSHLYGPVSGFTGGDLLLVDIRPYMSRRGLRFADVFEWSEEATPGSKPVLRSVHQEAALAECGTNLGPIGPREIVFVNNLPDAGILHGVTPVVVTDPAAFRREYHRCSAKAVAR